MKNTGLAGRLLWTVEHAEPRTQALAVGRTMLAAAPLVSLLVNPDSTLFSTTAEAPLCTGLRAVSVWCLLGPSDIGLLLSRIIAVAVLAAVVSGYRPRWTCVPHWYVAFSFTTTASVTDGGDRVALIAAMLLVPVLLGDHRRWIWQSPTTAMAPGSRGRACAGLFVLRLQVCLIYTSAVVTKSSDPVWRQGSAMYVVAHDANYGLPGPLLTLLEPALTSFPLVAAATWSVMAVQAVLALAILAGATFRKVVLALGISLHLGIALLMNLPVFGLAMIGLLVVGTVSLSPKREAQTLLTPTEELSR